MKRTKKQLLSLAFLLAALGLFVAFHFLSGPTPELGWHVWPRVWRDIQNPSHLDSIDAVIVAFFLNFTLLIVVSPFLQEVFHKSLWVWRGALIISGIPSVFFGVVFLHTLMYPRDYLGVGARCMQIAPFLNFIGLLLARGKSPKPSESTH